MSEPLFLQTLAGGVLTLTFNRPDKKNALNVPLWRDLADTLVAARQNDQVRCLVLTGAGRDFCAGTDLADFAGADGEHPFAAAAEALAQFDKPLLAAAQGIAVGGGATMLFHADVVYVGHSLRMRLPFVSLGLVPEFGSSYLLQANIGARRAAELFYTAEWITAERAVATGIATASYADAELAAAVQAKAAEIAQWPLNALRETKRCLKLAHQAGLQAAYQAEAEGMQRQVGSAENIEAITAFIEKRPPRFE